MDARKLKERATEAFAKGKFAKAGEAYAEYCAADPKDLQARLRMGDAWAKAGQKAKAIGAYQFAAEGFAKEGFLPRAIAASKLILELDPAHQGVQKMLAELYARKSGPSTGRQKTAASLSAPAASKHAPIELPKHDDVPLEIEESLSFKKRQPSSPEVVPIEVEATAAAAPTASVELDLTLAPPPSAPPPPPPPELELEAVPPAPELELEVVPPAPGLELEVAPHAPEQHLAPPAPPPAISELDVSVTGVTPGPALGAPEGPRPIEEAAPPLQVEVEPKDADGAGYELKIEDPPPEPGAVDPLAVVEGVAEKSQLQIAEESGRFKRAASGAYELDLDDAPAEPEMELEEPIALTQPKSPLRPIDESRLVAELEDAPRAAAEVGSPTPAREAPVESTAVPLQPPPTSRLWMPNNVVAAPGSEESAARRGIVAAPSTPKTDLERGLEAFARFEMEPVAGVKAAALSHTFTELELEGDSLLHAVETAATLGLTQRGQPVPSGAVEERMEAPEETRPEPGAMPKIPLFSDLPEDAFIALFERCPLRRLEPAEMVIRQGTLGDSFFVICAGSVRVYRIDGEVRRDIATLTEGAFFGEMALLSGAPRTASVEAASEDTQLLEIPAAILTELSNKYPTVAAALKKFCRQRLLANVMRTSALFSPFSRTERRNLVERFRARDVQKGEVLIREGQRSDGMYVVLSGEIEVSVGQTSVARLREGDVFGEMSLLTKAPATATCAAARRTSLLRLPRDDFDQIVLSHPQILVLVSELTDERKKQNAALASRSAPAAGEAVPMV